MMILKLPCCNIDTEKEKRFLKLSNTARSFSEIAAQASVFIPMSMPAKPLPSYVTLNSKSPWHVSGLFSAALESMAFPSRLKTSRETLDQLASALNVNGNQNIAKLRMSIDQKTALNGHDRSGRLEVRAQSRDMRVLSQDRSVNNILSDDDPSIFDIDFFPAEAADHVRGRRNGKDVHVFGQVETSRGDADKQDMGTNEEDDGQERARRRAAGLPIIQKSVHLFLSSFIAPKAEVHGIIYGFNYGSS